MEMMRDMIGTIQTEFPTDGRIVCTYANHACGQDWHLAAEAICGAIIKSGLAATAAARRATASREGRGLDDVSRRRAAGRGVAESS